MGTVPRAGVLPPPATWRVQGGDGASASETAPPAKPALATTWLATRSIIVGELLLYQYQARRLP